MKPTALVQSQTHSCIRDVKFGTGQQKPGSFAFSNCINAGACERGLSVENKPENTFFAKANGLQQTVRQAVSTLSLTLDMTSQKYGGVDQNGFNSNNIYDRITEVVNQVKDLVCNLREAGNGAKSCPTGGKLEALNTEIESKQDKLSNDTMSMTTEIHDILIGIKGLLVELLSLMNGRGNFHSQARS